jgi:glycerol-3-phosphate dehydrogenase
VLGIRYLEKAILGMDYSQWHLVSEALHERATLLRLAPHLSRPLPIMIPVYDLFSLPYMYAGAKMYDFVAGARTLFNSRFLSREETLHSFPTLNPKQLVGSVV